MARLHWVDRLLIGFLVFWTLITLVGDALGSWDLYRQSRAKDYPRVRGEITKSDTADRDYDVAEFNVEYRYSVAEKEYIGRRYVYNAGEFGGPHTCRPGKARELADSLPVGEWVPVYYNPSDPSDSLLMPGIVGCHVFMLAVLAFFNLMMIVGWTTLAILVVQR